MKNINIRAVYIEKSIVQSSCAKEKIALLEKMGIMVKTIDCDEFKKIFTTINIPLFNQCALGGNEFLSTAKELGIRCVYSDEKCFSELNVKTFSEWGKVSAYEIDENAFVEGEIDITDVGHLESIFALGNGYLGLRGTYDERDEEISEISGMYINGIFESEPISHPWYCRGFAKNEQYTVNLCDWRIIEIYINGEKVCFSNGIVKHRRRLDFSRGEVVRTFEFSAKNGGTICVESVRIVNLSSPHSAQIKYTIKSVDFNGDIEIRSSVIKNTPINDKITTTTLNEYINNEKFSILTQTKRTKKSVATAISHKVNTTNFKDEIINNDIEYVYIVHTSLKKNESVCIEKFATFYSTEDKKENIIMLAEEENEKNCNQGFDALREEETKSWGQHWENSDVKIEGNKEDQQAVRLCLFHLRSQLPTINYASIGATGLTGANYSGKVFWDTEMYLMPYYLFTNPESCKSLILYRTKLLEKARERAKEIGNEGALYSWCSIDGEETSVVFEASTAEYHINADIAYAVWRYEKSTNDSEFVYNNCVQMIFETAKFYAHRGSFVEAHGGRFCLNSVCGPDEYACGVNNNCYTNFMVRFHLNYALELYERVKMVYPEKLAEIMIESKIDEAELSLWKEAADKIYYSINEKYGIYEQDDRFIYNDAVDLDLIPKNYDIRMLYHPLDLWRMQVLKQADVVLLQFVLGNLFTIDEKKRNYDYYEPKTNHGSSLSTAIHSIIANEIGYTEDAYEYFRSSAYMDIGDFKKNTYGGIHIACHGGVWMAVINGFMGMRLYEDGLHFAPKLPKAWEKCIFKFNYNGATMEVIAEENKTTFTLVNGEKLKFKVYGNEVFIDENNKTFVAMC